MSNVTSAFLRKNWNKSLVFLGLHELFVFYELGVRDLTCCLVLLVDLRVRIGYSNFISGTLGICQAEPLVNSIDKPRSRDNNTLHTEPPAPRFLEAMMSPASR